MPKSFNEEYAKHGINCTICLEGYTGESQVVMTPCFHVFHSACLMSWFNENPLKQKCPNCNTNIVEGYQANEKPIELPIVEREESPRHHGIPTNRNTEEGMIHLNNIYNNINQNNENKLIVVQNTPQCQKGEGSNSTQNDNTVTENETKNISNPKQEESSAKITEVNVTIYVKENNIVQTNPPVTKNP